MNESEINKDAKGKGERGRGGGWGDKKYEGKRKGEEGGLGRREGKGVLAATLLFSSFICSQANVKIPLAKRCDDCQSRNISYRTCCFANRDRGGRFVRVVYGRNLGFARSNFN